MAICLPGVVSVSIRQCSQNPRLIVSKNDVKPIYTEQRDCHQPRCILCIWSQILEKRKWFTVCKTTRPRTCENHSKKPMPIKQTSLVIWPVVWLIWSFLSRTVYKDVDVIGKNKKHRGNIKLNVTTKWLVSVLCRRSGLVLENLTGS